MGLFSILKKKKKSKDDSNNTGSNIIEPINFPTPKTEVPSLNQNNLETPILEPQKTESKKITNNDLRTLINKDVDKPITEFDLESTKKDNEYVDKTLSNDLSLVPIDNHKIKELQNRYKEVDENLENLKDNSLPIRVNEQILEPKKVHPELKQKIDSPHEPIHIEEEAVDTLEHNVLKETKKVSNKNIEEDLLDLQEKYSSESPNKKNDNSLELPDFGEKGKEIKHKNKGVLLNRLKQRKEIKGDLFVKSTLFREMLHSNLVIKEDIKICENKLDNVDKNIVAQTKEKEKLKSQLDSMQENMMLIDDKLFGDNPFTR